MSVLISDKNIPFSSVLAGVLRQKDVSVALLSSESSVANDHPVSAVSSSDLIEIPWNRPSILSVQTVLLEIKNSFHGLDQAVLIFDCPFFAETEKGTSSLDSVRVAEELIKSFILLAGEITSYFSVMKKGRLVFVVRPLSVRGTNIPVSVAESAFIRLAEETAAFLSASGNPQLQSLLVRLESTEDAENAAWLVEQMDALVGVRRDIRWIKAGTRGLFGKL